MASVEDMEFIKAMVRLCGDGWLFGWHERNAGNLSYRLTEEESQACKGLACAAVEPSDWVASGFRLPELAGACICVSGAGQCFRNASDEPGRVFGIVELSEDASSYRVLWGLEGGRPTSEFPTHLLAHAARIRACERMHGSDSLHMADRVVYHAHCPNVIALSNIIAPESRVWTRTLWRTMTEAILFFPQGVGALPWMVPGGSEIARASEAVLEEHPACVWTQHGIFATAPSFDEVFGLVHMIEKTAGIYLQGRAACGGCETPFAVDDAQLRLICEESGVSFREDFLD